MFKRNRLISQVYRWASINIEQKRWSNGYCRKKPFYMCSTNINTVGISRMRVWRHCIKTNYTHTISKRFRSDYQAPMELCQWLLGYYEPLDNILLTDECTLTRENTINMHNLHMWSLENPHAKFERNFQHRIAINIWCGLIGSNIIGLLYFESINI